MMYVLIILLVIIAIVLILLKKKKISNGKKILFVLLICIIAFACIKIFVKWHDIIFFFQSIEYENVDKYDYSSDIYNTGHISKEGAIKIAKEKTNKKRIAKVSCELVENGTYINIYEMFKEPVNKPSDILQNEKEGTFWLITLITGWDHSCGHEEEWTLKVDYYTGEILEWDVTM